MKDELTLNMYKTVKIYIFSYLLLILTHSAEPLHLSLSRDPN